MEVTLHVMYFLATWYSKNPTARQVTAIIASNVMGDTELVLLALAAEVPPPGVHMEAAAGELDPEGHGMQAEDELLPTSGL